MTESYTIQFTDNQKKKYESQNLAQVDANFLRLIIQSQKIEYSHR